MGGGSEIRFPFRVLYFMRAPYYIGDLQRHLALENYPRGGALKNCKSAFRASYDSMHAIEPQTLF